MFLGSSRMNSERSLRLEKSSTRLWIGDLLVAPVTSPKHEKPCTLMITWLSVTWSGLMRSMLSPVTWATDKKWQWLSVTHKNSASAKLNEVMQMQVQTAMTLKDLTFEQLAVRQVESLEASCKEGESEERTSRPQTFGQQEVHVPGNHLIDHIPGTL